MKVKRAPAPSALDVPLETFEHTHIAVYLCGLFAVACICYDSIQGVMQKYAINRKWFYLYGAIIFFAYLYIRPLIRRGLGSASEGYLNYYSVYLFWLGSAVFVHLPSFQSMGIDVKADISMLLTIFLLSLLILGALHAIHAVAVFFKLMSPALYSTGRRSMYTLVILNSLNLAVACSTYYSFCGNATLKPKDGTTGQFKESVCSKWLHPVAIKNHPAFASWVLYGEGAGLVTTQPKSAQILNIDVPFDGLGLISIPASETISPVFTMWITLVAMYTVHCWGDYQAARDMRVRSASGLRRQLTSGGHSSRRRRRFSAGFTPTEPKQDTAMKRAATLLEPIGIDLASFGSSFLSSMSKNLDTLLLAPTRSMLLDDANGRRSRGKEPAGGEQGGRGKRVGPGKRLNHQGVYDEEEQADNVGKTGDQRSQRGQYGEDQPEFLPMFPWYSGTSADMYRTVFDLLVSVKLFLGRFDMRTMQAATASVPSGGDSAPPQAGDGFTFEHLADRPELWLDFCADTGDGGNPTYAVARAMAAPSLKVTVPAGMDVPINKVSDSPMQPKGKSAPAALELMSQHGAEDGHPHRGRSRTNPHVSRAPAGSSPHRPHAVQSANAQDSSSGLDTSGWSDSPDSSSEVDYSSPSQQQGRAQGHRRTSAHLPRQATIQVAQSPFDALAAQHASPAGTQSRFGFTHTSTADMGSEASRAFSNRPVSMQLPRADVLVIGGDLAYPNPSNETYEQRFFRPFEAALPPPPHVRPGRLVVHKPDLPEASDSHTQDPSEVLHHYAGPTAFAIPGNHDWIDGLETYTRHIQHKGWLGGWLLPQEKSYFALALPHGWWLFGIDLALVDDIDMCQCRYFARIADERMAADDQVILVTHQPRWLSDWFWDETACHNLRQLVRGHLKGRARLHLAGDLHFYMRHSFQPYQPSTQPSSQPPSRSTSSLPTHQASSSSQGNAVDVQASLPDHHRPGATISRGKSSNLAAKTSAAAAAVQASLLDKLRPSAAQTANKAHRSRHSARVEFEQPATESSAASTASDEVTDLPSQLGLEDASSSTTRTAGWHPHDPEHLIVNGLGGAFLHPTHVFSPSRFISVPDPSADEATVTNTRPTANATLRGRSPPRGSSPRGSSPIRRGSPRGASPTSSFARRIALAAADQGLVKADDNEEAELWSGGEYHCMAAYPTPSCSMQLGKQNLHLFRLKNTRFDIIGGMFYFCLVVSVLPRCNSVSAVLDAHSLSEALQLLLGAVRDAIGIIFAESYLSLAALMMMFLMAFGFASAGGVGASPASTGSTVAKFAKDEDSIRSRLALRARTGGALTKCVFAGVHTATHLLVALMLMVLLELGVETCIRYESVGKEGYHSLYKWYQAFEAEHFPDPKGLRDTITRWSLHIYPNCIQAAMALFDIPEAIAVSRTKLCLAGSIRELSRLQAAAYYLGMLAYYWVLATPAVGFLFGCYLYIAVNWFHVHYDEAFSALRIPNFKGFSRLHINRDGDLEVYGLAMDKVPYAWREDPKWRGPDGAGNRKGYAHQAEYPSRWIPTQGQRQPELDDYDGLESQQAGDIRIMDHLVVPKVRPAW